MPYINELWQGISLEGYNKWYPLTGKITDIPRGYDKYYENVQEWFKTFALRAQNDIDAYLNFPFQRFPFHIFVDEDLKGIIRDCVYVLIEHWLFNRIPVEFFTGSSAKVRSGTEYNAPLLNIGLQPSRMKMWTQLTGIKKIFQTYNGDLNKIDIAEIDLNFFYSKVETDKLLKEEHNFSSSNYDALDKKIDKQSNILQSNIDTKQNINDQILYQQVSDAEGNPTGKIEKIDRFDEMLIIDRVAANTVITTEEGKKRAVINLNKDVGAIIDADTKQTTDQTDTVNPIGRVWGYGVENDIKLIKPDLNNTKSDLNNTKSDLTTVKNRINNINSNYGVETSKWTKIEKTSGEFDDYEKTNDKWYMLIYRTFDNIRSRPDSKKISFISFPKITFFNWTMGFNGKYMPSVSIVKYSTDQNGQSNYLGIANTSFMHSTVKGIYSDKLNTDNEFLHWNKGELDNVIISVYRWDGQGIPIMAGGNISIEWEKHST